ncbi:chloride channel protein, CIC family [Pseudarcicella hirudinis]|uniref:Chloride channel protein, CIC family n=1 Tax=Pseudarcicella hirudinis TaxID=1079859 RepID=A0A1I5SX25_9BACT|nr:chloride channel protein [Pseudarcicella hirudinis]SFP75344.1 chloride channel protein, CIC family [Pseudarcicella hirudinis]
MQRKRKLVRFINRSKLVSLILLIAISATLLADLLKVITEKMEHYFFHFYQENPLKILIGISPLIGLLAIFSIRKFIFSNKPNKGITEVIENLNSQKRTLKKDRIFSHFVNGWLTVIFGGSTGIEVSTVVSTAAIGSVAGDFVNRKEISNWLVMAGVSAGITALFNAPLAGIFFVVEVLMTNFSMTALSITVLSALTAGGLNYFMNQESFFQIAQTDWHMQAMPFFFLLGGIAALFSVYLTQTIIRVKKKFSEISSGFIKVLLGGLLIGTGILVFPSLYGEGYLTIKNLLTGNADKIGFGIVSSTYQYWQVILILCMILLFKPIITSFTLASGGDGGVFAPSLFLGAIVGFLVAQFINQTGLGHVVEINFVIVGMAAVLSASIHAPFTAIALVLGLTGNYQILLPTLITSLVAFGFARKIQPYTVYSYNPAR